MFALKQTCPQHLFLIIMKNLAQNVWAFKQILGKKTIFFKITAAFVSKVIQNCVNIFVKWI